MLMKFSKSAQYLNLFHPDYGHESKTKGNEKIKLVSLFFFWYIQSPFCIHVGTRSQKDPGHI